ncbi:unnamed protein product [Rangifer tarandus platyrhynchus]|uniref:Uncharacterized protein n=1 Tax=Rangifer tarandus platyrhynchus TaxID=3082113 RepID=A0ABN8YYX9_RANTA|nr:unnamed protein product [Rangifer tarandus platyrhynchus]
MMASVIFRSRSSSRWASTTAQRRPALAHAVQVALELQGLDLEEESWPLTTCHPSHHGVLEKGQGPGSGLCSADGLLLVQGKWGGGTPGRGREVVSTGQVRSQTCRETQNPGPEGILPAGISFPVHF